jgi:hypothetical protein
MRHATRREDDGAGASRELLRSDREDVVALDDVEELVLIRVDVQRRVERINLLDDRERTPGRLTARLDEELRARKRQPLACAGVEPVCRCGRPTDGTESSQVTIVA